MPGPPPLSFLGITIDVDWPSDLQYSVKMLASQDTRSFFMGLNILVAIHAFNADPVKRGLAERLLDALCRVMPSFVKKDIDNDRYDINKTKMDASIKTNQHPLDLSGAITRALPAAGGNDDNITIVSVENARDVERRLVSQVKLDIVSPSLEAGAIDDTASIHPQQPPKGIPGQPDVDVKDDQEEWIDAGFARGTIQKEIMFDTLGEISEMLEEGLSLINPIDRVFPDEENVSGAGGYRDPYSSPPPATATQNGPALRFSPVPATSVAGQGCALGDGVIDVDDAGAFTCPVCQAAFHETCATLVLDFQGGSCPACNARLSR